jgi:hypothetical protein
LSKRTFSVGKIAGEFYGWTLWAANEQGKTELAPLDEHSFLTVNMGIIARLVFRGFSADTTC